MPKITVDEKLVEHVASLARLRIPKNEISQYVNYMQQVLAYVELLDTVNTDHVTPFFSPVMEAQPIFLEKIKSAFVDHADEISPSLQNAAILKNAPDQSQNQYKIRAIIEEQ